MKRLVLSAWLAGLAIAGAAPASAADDAGTPAESAAKPSRSSTGKAAPLKLAHAKSPAQPRKFQAAVTKTAREAEAIEAVSTADTSAPSQAADAPANAAPTDRQSASVASTERPDDAVAAADSESKPVEAKAGEAQTADPKTDPKTADPKTAETKTMHMNTGHPQIDALVAIHAKANDVPETLVHRVIVRESKYQKDLVGRCGCIGLMQIKLGTARGLGYTGDAQGLHDPATNLTYGIKYLAGAYRAAHGDHDRAVHYFARGYYEVAKQQRLAETGLARPERLHAPLDITPKLAGLKHMAQATAAKPIRQAAAK